jgi:hypothetical protein
MAETLIKYPEQEAMPPNDPAKVGAKELTCKRLSENSMIYNICFDDHPAEGLHCLQNMLAFVMDCLSVMRTAQDVTFSAEGSSGLWSFLHIIEKGMKEIEAAF